MQGPDSTGIAILVGPAQAFFIRCGCDARSSQVRPTIPRASLRIGGRLQGAPRRPAVGCPPPAAQNSPRSPPHLLPAALAARRAPSKTPNIGGQPNPTEPTQSMCRRQLIQIAAALPPKADLCHARLVSAVKCRSCHVCVASRWPPSSCPRSGVPTNGGGRPWSIPDIL